MTTIAPIKSGSSQSSTPAGEAAGSGAGTTFAGILAVIAAPPQDQAQQPSAGTPSGQGVAATGASSASTGPTGTGTGSLADATSGSSGQGDAGAGTDVGTAGGRGTGQPDVEAAGARHARFGQGGVGLGRRGHGRRRHEQRSGHRRSHGGWPERDCRRYRSSRWRAVGHCGRWTGDRSWGRHLAETVAAEASQAANAAVTAIATGQDVGGNSQAAPATATGAPAGMPPTSVTVSQATGLATSASASSASQQISDLVAAVSPAGQVQISVGQIGSGQTGLTGPALTPSGAGQPAELGGGRAIAGASEAIAGASLAPTAGAATAGAAAAGRGAADGPRVNALAGAARQSTAPASADLSPGAAADVNVSPGATVTTTVGATGGASVTGPMASDAAWRQRAQHIGSRRRRRRLRRCEQRNHRGHGPERCRSGEHGRRTERGFGWERHFPLGPSRPDHSPCGTSGRPCNWSCERF